MWHNLSKVQIFYATTLGIKFPEIQELYKAVAVRHDIVHRGGKTKDGKSHTITKIQVQNLIAQSENLIKEIETQWENIEDADAAIFFSVSTNDED